MIIFDLDGTLWNTERLTFEASKEIAKINEEVKDFKIDTIKQGMGLSYDENVKLYFPYLDYDKGKKYLNQITKKTRELIEINDVDFYDNLNDTIKTLSKNHKLGLVTNNKDSYCELFLKKSNLSNYFTDYIGAGDYQISKAEALRRLADRNGFNNFVYVGDILLDKIATEEAGGIFIHAKYGFQPYIDCKYAINDLKELNKLIDIIL